MAAVSTICIVGFPAEVATRELKNLCRFIQGFEGAHVAYAGGGSQGQATALFVKFQTPEAAVSAIDRLHGQAFDVDMPGFSLKAELARREMEVRAHTAPSVTLPAAVPLRSAPGYSGPRTTSGEEIVTITVLGVKEKGLRHAELQHWFRGRPGFVKDQPNERIDALFVKFDTSAHAEMAMRDVRNALPQVEGSAEWARRNLDDDRLGAMADRSGSNVSTGQAPAAWPQGLPSAPPAGPGPRRGSPYGPPAVPLLQEELTTLTVQGLQEKGFTIPDLQHWFQERPGFLSLQVNERIGGLFVKFTTSAAAEQALQEANAEGCQFGAEWARRNLDDVSKHSVPSAPPWDWAAPPPGPGPPALKRQRSWGGDVDTITILGLRDKTQKHGDLKQYFQDLSEFRALQINERIDALFVKFSSPAAAQQALQTCNDLQLGAELARRNLDL